MECHPMTDPLPAWFSIPELADLTGKHRHTVRRLLDAAHVPLDRSGRKVVVFTSTLRRAMPDLVRAIEDRRLEKLTSKTSA